jgi:hypothetical protein
MEQPAPRVLVIVGHALYEPWKSILYSGQLKTWADNPLYDIKHVHAQPVDGFPRKVDVKIWNLKWNPKFGRIVTVIEIFFKFFVPIFQGKLRDGFLPGTKFKSASINLPDFDLLMNYKSFAIITGTLKYEYDYLVTTTSSSYLNLRLLTQEIHKLPRTKIVAGRILDQGNIRFASGSFRIISRDVIESFLEFRRKYSKWRPEDLAYGYLIGKYLPEVKHYEIASRDISTIEELMDLDESDLKAVVHYRLKSGTHENRNDVSIMKKLHERIVL